MDTGVLVLAAGLVFSPSTHTDVAISDKAGCGPAGGDGTSNENNNGGSWQTRYANSRMVDLRC